jgi:hypothetical protein
VEAYIVTLGQMGGSLERTAAGEDDGAELAAMPPGATAPAPEQAGQEWSF